MEKLLIIEVDDASALGDQDEILTHLPGGSVEGVRHADMVLVTDGEKGRIIKDRHGPARDVDVVWFEES